MSEHGDRAVDVGHGTRRLSAPWRLVAACVLTLLGLAAGAAGVALLPGPSAAPLLLASVGVDGVDGALARRLGAATDAGAWLDWSIDTALGYAIVFRLLVDYPVAAVLVMGVLVVTQTLSRATGFRASGRTPVTAVAVAWVVLR